jgi:hypothetical protein
MNRARRLGRVFDIDFERCSFGGRLEIIAALVEPTARRTRSLRTSRPTSRPPSRFFGLVFGDRTRIVADGGGSFPDNHNEAIYAFKYTPVPEPAASSRCRQGWRSWRRDGGTALDRWLPAVRSARAVTIGGI